MVTKTHIIYPSRRHGLLPLSPQWAIGLLVWCLVLTHNYKYQVNTMSMATNELILRFLCQSACIYLKTTLHSTNC